MSNIVDYNDKVQSKLSSQCREFFNEEWTLYQKILRCNYMNHQEIYADLQSFLMSDKKNQFRLLDLGCGDASFMANSLKNTGIGFYCGLDLSDTAIDIAKKNMQIISCKKKFLQGDFCMVIPSLVKHSVQKFDLIFTSFAFHHLSGEQKNYIFGQIQELLLPEGLFIMIDLMSREYETREAYLERYLQNVNKEWLQLSPAELNLVSTHMLTHDYPETARKIEEIALKNGLEAKKHLERQNDTAQTILFGHSNSAAVV